jgi:SAM-dependent methyltransferase
MFSGISLSGMDVLEAMCGSGQTTAYLLSKGCKVTGLDISTEEIKSFKRGWPGCRIKCASILDSGLASESFDCVAIVGGLHHLQPNLARAVDEIHRVLKPNGYFCFAEPHKGSVPDVIRAYWYKYDNFFATNEASIDLKTLKDEFHTKFRFNKEIYFGNIAYLLVLNSMIFRIPVGLKPLYTPTMLRIESMASKFQGKLSSCFAVCQWQKK